MLRLRPAGGGGARSGRAAAEPAERRRVVVPAGRTGRRARRAPRRPAALPVAALLLLAAAAGCAWWAWSGGTLFSATRRAAPAAGPGAGAPPGAVVVGTHRGAWNGELGDLERPGEEGAEAPAAAGPGPRPGAAAPAPDAVDDGAALAGTDEAEATSSHPLFVRGARQFNAALALFRQYRADPRRGELLTRIEQLGEQAARDFTAYREQVPGDPRVDRYIEQCYGMVRYARQSRLSDHGLERHAPARRTAPRARNTVQKRLEALRAAGGEPLRLAGGWNAPARVDTPAAVLREVRALLHGRGLARTDLQPRPGLVVFGQIGYLSPAASAAAAAGAALAAPTGVTCPAYPRDSFRYYTLEGRFDGRFPLMRVLTDTADKVVAVQLIEERPAGERMLPDVLFADRWNVFDLVEGRTRRGAARRIAHRVRVEGDVLRIETEMAERADGAPGGIGRSLVRACLYLPRPVADLMLVRLQGVR